MHTAKQMEMTEWFKAGGTEHNLMYGKRMSLGNISNQSCHIEHKDVEMIEAVGEGAFGLVMKGRYKETVVAVKKLSITLEQCNQTVLMEFGAEASVMAELRHPNIVMFMGVTVHPEFIALVMEFLPKGNVYNLLHVDKGDLDFSLLLRILCDSARGMNYLHQYSPPIIHKDLKSLNILLSTDWRGKIADFGLSTLQKAVEEAKGEKKEDETSFTGSIVWAAPEVLEGNEANQKSDVYAFGIVLWEVLTREMPYRFLAQEAIPFNVTSNKRPCHYSESYQEMKLDFDELPHKSAMNSLMEDCWSQDPDDRPTFAHCIRVIEEAAQKYLCGDDSNKDWEELCLFPDRKVQASNGVGDLEFSISEADLTVGATIGKGSFGAVFKGSYIGTTVAIKKLFMKGVPVEILNDFHKECNIMQQLRHPNVVLFMGSCCKPPNLLLITEFLDQGSFFDVYHKLPKHPKKNAHLMRVLDLGIDMCKGIGYLHHHNPPIVHRDLKSQNVMVDDKWTSKIGDFGLSRFKDAGKTMSMCGSPLWIAPEVLRGENYGVGCDIFSFSIILWEAIAWSEPYPSMSSNRVMRGVSAGTLRPEKPEDCPDKLFSILKHCWAEDANHRPTMEETLEMLEHQRKKLKESDANAETAM
jgi:Janus kinase 2